MAGDVGAQNCMRRSMSPNSDFAGFLVRTGSVMSHSSRFSRSSVMALEGEALEEYCKQVFQLCDSDGDGYITEKDMVQQCGEDLQTLESVMKYLDKDNDGRVSFEEFLSGFKIYQDTHKEEDDGEDSEDRGRGHSVSPSTPCIDGKYFLEESVFESDPSNVTDSSSWLEVARRIDPGGLLNKSDVASVWAALEQNDPSLLDNFESFLSEVVEELHQSQSARETMEHHVKKVLNRHHKEASELDDMVKQRLCEAEESLIMKSAEKSRNLSKRYQNLLAERDALISELSANQSTLRQALEEKMESEAVLRQERARLIADNKVLQERLEYSMTQVAEEESKKALLRGRVSLPDIRKMDESDDHHHGYTAGFPECSTPTSVKTFKSIANHGKSCSLHNLFRGENGNGEGDSGSLVEEKQMPDIAQNSGSHPYSGEPTFSQTTGSPPNSSEHTFSSPAHTLSSNDSFVNIASNQCSPSHATGDHNGGSQPIQTKDVKLNANDTTGRTSPDGQPVVANHTALTTDDVVKSVPSYLQSRHCGPVAYDSNSLVSSGPIAYGHTDGNRAIVGSGWFTSSNQLPKAAGAVTRVFKVASLGDCGVGKSTLITYLSQGEFRHCTATVGVDFITKTLTVEDERVVLQLWDTAGQEKFRSVTVAHYRRADAFIIVYDVTNAKTFKDVLSWVNIIKTAIRDDAPVLMLIGNKCDRANERVVSKEDGLRMAASLNAVFAETSAFSGSNVIEAHKNLARLLLQKEDDAILVTRRLLIQPTTSARKSCAC